MQIVPAIIAKSFDDLEEKMSNVSSLAPLVQVDVLDGSLVKLRAWPYQSASKPDDFFQSIIREEQGFPFWKSLEFEAHFMVNSPEKIVSDWIAAGAARIIFEIEGVKDFETAVAEVNGRVPIGVSLTLDTPDDTVALAARHTDVIQCMGWEFSHLGRQGEPLDTRVFEKIKGLREKYPSHMIAIDGGVTFQNAAKLLEAGADKLVIGSALWKGGNVHENFAKFKKILG